MVGLRLLRSAFPMIAAVVLLAAIPIPAAYAQALAAIVNGDPITTTEVDEQMKFRRLIRQPAGRNEALEDLIADRLKLRQANRLGVDASDASFSQALNAIAAKANQSSSGLLAEFQKAKLNIDLVRSHVRAVAAWNDFVRSRNKALSVSQQEVDAAIAKDASSARGGTDYTLQQIVFVVPTGATVAVAEQRMREAQALRTRFDNCESGIPLARALPDVAVKPPITKASTALSEATRKSLAQIQKGKLTMPDRTVAGIEMVAVCNKTDDTDRTSVRDTVQANLLVERLSKEADRMYQELRAKAVVDKR